MPTYDYKCEHCGRFQVTQRITEDPLKECPTCGQAVERLISRNVSIVFKGSGFYCTDNRAANPGVSQQPKSKADEPKSEAKSEAKQEKAETPPAS
ncbi:MAG: FmdB family zinc ribbon protein [Syntrophaceticus sp.]|jgi:putative FmdB family regulatory protein